MEVLLLGALAYVGNEYIKRNKKIDDKPDVKIKDTFSATVSESIAQKPKPKIEEKEKELVPIKKETVEINHNKLDLPESFPVYREVKQTELKQKTLLDELFEPLTYSNKGTVASNQIEESCKNNNYMERELAYVSGFSNVNDGFTYGMTDERDFYHNNMVPSTSARDYVQPNYDNFDTKLHIMTGSSREYKPKAEQGPLFEPMADITKAQGQKTNTEDMEDRYVTTYKKNNTDLPFENKVRVKPGLAGDIQIGLYNTDRVLPKNIDDLRNGNNQKVSYESKPIAPPRMGEKRQMETTVQQHKLPFYKEYKAEELIATDGMAKPTVPGKYKEVNTNRSASMQVIGHAATNMANKLGKDASHYTPTNRVTYEGNYQGTGITMGGNNQAINNKKAYNMEINNRNTTQQNEIGHVNNAASGNYAKNPNDRARETIKEGTIHQSYASNVNGSSNAKSYILSNDMIAKQTVKETTLHQKHGNANFSSAGYVANTEPVRTTVKETTMYHNNGNIAGNQITYTNNNQEARQTTKETTLYSNDGNVKGLQRGHIYDPTDIPLATIKETTIHQKHGNARIEGGNYIKNNDVAKPTIKESSLFSYQGNAAQANMSRQRIKDDKTRQTVKETVIYANNGNISFQNTSGYIKNGQQANTTIKETTIHNTNGNIAVQQHGYVLNPDDVPDATLKDQVLFSRKGNMDSGVEASYVKNPEEIARPTIKQSTLAPSQTNVKGYTNGYVLDKDDKARVTIKDTTLIKDWTGAANSNNKKIMSYQDAYNMETNDCRESSLVSRANPGGRGLMRANINKDNVRLREETSMSRVEAGRMPIDYSAIPSIDTFNRSSTYHNTAFKTDYHIDPIKTDTLNENPYIVNRPFKRRD